MAQPIYNIPEQQEPNAKLELLKSATQEIFNKTDIEVKTDLDPNQIMLMANAKFFATRYKSTVLNVYTQDIMQLLLSKNRKSRQEHSALAKALVQSEQAEETDKMGIQERLFGRSR